MSKLEIPQSINENVQIVGNYLKLLKEDKINKFNLYFENISTEKFDKKFDIKAILFENDNKCEDLINEKIKNFNFYQKQIFINILANQLKVLTKHFFFNTKNLFEYIQEKPDLKNIRKLIIENLIDLTKNFTTNSYNSIINEQNNVLIENIIKTEDKKKEDDQQNNLENNKNEINEKANEILSEINTIKFEQISSYVFFNEDEFSISIISNIKKDTNEYKQLYALYNSQELDKKNFKDLIDFNNLDNKGFLKEIKKVLNLQNEIEKNKKYLFDLFSLEKLTENYAFTKDNYIKLILILLRIRAKIPVIMMGETGCGKTSLIKMIAKLNKQNEIFNIRKKIENFLIKIKDLVDEKNFKEKLNKIFEKQMIILNIHAGTTDNDIIERIQKENLFEDQIYNKEFIDFKFEYYKIYENLKEFFNLLEKQKIWVFLDEINTCNSMGLISEMLCKHTVQGRKIRENVLFFAACNPYRKILKKPDIPGLINKENFHIVSKWENVVYNVNPLPHSLINFVFNFGSLNEKDEEEYINKIISPCFNKIKENLEITEEDFKDIKQITINSIVFSQNFIRNINDVSSVSLRELRRFIILFEWFIKFLTEYYEGEPLIKFDSINNNFIEKNNKINKQNYLFALNLSLFICYYVRITTEENKNNYQEKIKEKLKIENNFIDFPLKISNYILDEIEIKPGIAKNKTLKTNILINYFCMY